MKQAVKPIEVGSLGSLALMLSQACDTSYIDHSYKNMRSFSMHSLKVSRIYVLNLNYLDI